MTTRKTFLLVTNQVSGKKTSHSSIKKICEQYPEMSQSYLRNKKLPIVYKVKYIIERIKIDE